MAILTYLGLLGHWANVREVGGGVIEWQGRYEVWAIVRFGWLLELLAELTNGSNVFLL